MWNRFILGAHLCLLLRDHWSSHTYAGRCCNAGALFVLTHAHAVTSQAVVLLLCINANSVGFVTNGGFKICTL